MLGQKLGTAAHVCSLRRTSIGGFKVEDATSIDKIKKMSPEEVLKCVKIL
jgi:tRNA U55 pseudouridine synthase TruB